MGLALFGEAQPILGHGGPQQVTAELLELLAIVPIDGRMMNHPRTRPIAGNAAGPRRQASGAGSGGP